MCWKDLRFDWEKESAYGTTAVTLAPFKDANKISLDAASMTINSVKLASGANLKYTYDDKRDGDNLEIELDRVYKGGEDVTVTIDYRTNYVNKADEDTAIGSFGRGLRYIKPTAEEPNKPMQIWSQGETEFNRYWFPSYDSPNDFRTSELKATVDKKYTVVSNGKLMSVTPNADGTRTFYWKMDTPYSNYLTSIVVGEFTDVKQIAGGIPVSNYGYKNETREVAATVKNLPDMINFFSAKTGVKYAYPKYSQAMVEDFGGGMENISATTMIEEMIHDDRELLEGDSDGLMAHELAHQWFGDYVTCRDWGQIWLNESFATYFDALYQEHKKGRDHFLYNEVRNNQNQVLASWMQGNRRPIVTKYYANKDAMFDNYAYPGGGSVLHMLRKHLGDANWWKAINHYLKSNAHQPVSTEEFRIAIEEATGQSMDWFFDQWLYKMGHPVFEVTQNYDAAAKKLTLSVKQTQKLDPNNPFPQVQFFQTFVDVEIDNRVERVWIKPQAENVFTFDAAAKPKLVNFDYEGAILKEMRFEKSVDELVYQALNDKDPVGRGWAMDELSSERVVPSDATEAQKAEAKQNEQKIVGAFASVIKNDAFWTLRSEAIEKILGFYPPVPIFEKQVEDALTAAAKDKDARVRAAAISTLALSKNAKYANIYFAALGDPSYAVIDAAAAALGATKDARAYAALNKLLTTPSWHSRIQIAGLRGLGALGDPRAFEGAFKLANDKTQPLGARTAALTVVASSGKGNPRAFDLIFDGFKKSLDAMDERGLLNSVQAIIMLGDPRGQQAFDMLKEKFKNDEQVLKIIGNFEDQFKKAIAK